MEFITKYEKTIKGVWRPVVEVNLSGINGKSCNFSMLIDSGADKTVINLSAGKFLGFNLDDADNKTQITGIGGSLTAIYKNIGLSIFNKKIDLLACWILSDKTPLLIGRDVFDFFHITFKQDKKITVFIPITSETGFRQT